MNSVKNEALPALFDVVSRHMAANADELCKMDAMLGDGDLGLTMKKGFGAMPDILRELDEPDIGKKLMKGGMKMANVAPSTMGTLMGSGIMAGGKALVGESELNASNFCVFMAAFSDGVAKRGKCARGERTLLDAVGAAADAAKEALAENPEAALDIIVGAALSGARSGVEATRNMQPKHGKAAVLQASASGLPDQGACAGMYMLEGIYEYING